MTRKGEHHTEETKKKISLAKKGQLPWCTGKKRGPLTDEWKRKIAEKSRGRKLSPEAIEKRRATFKRNWSPERAKKWGEAHKGSKCNFWKGGKTAEHHRLKMTLEYSEWRKKVFERDDYTCQFCRQKGNKIQADHIRPFSLYPELRFDISNGRTLCRKCHYKTSTYGTKLQAKAVQIDLL